MHRHMLMYKRAAIWCDTFGYNFSVLRIKLAHPASHPTSSNLEHELLELPPTHGPIKIRQHFYYVTTPPLSTSPISTDIFPKLRATD